MPNNLPSSLKQIIELTPPEQSHLASARPSILLKCARHFLTEWQSLIDRHPEISAQAIEYTCPTNHTTRHLGGRDLYWRVYLVLGSYYDYAIRRLLNHEPNRRSGPIPGLNIRENKEFLNNAPSDSAAPDCIVAHLAIAQYECTFSGLYFARLFRQMSIVNSPTQALEADAHSSLLDLNRLRNDADSVHPDFLHMCNLMVDGMLSFAKDIYAWTGSTWNEEHRAGPFSAIRVHELSLLAQRADKLKDRYGSKNIEKIFEEQLALVLQSFGFIVIRTRRGLRTVDLVCISGDSQDSTTVLVEAKTSKRPYSLPASDERALRDYVRDVRKNLTTLPALSFVLLIVPSASRTLEDKLRALDAKSGVPVRALAAIELANLREAFPGPLPIGMFRDVVLSSPNRVLTGIVESVSNAHREVEAAHETLVHTLLDGGRTTNLRKQR